MTCSTSATSSLIRQMIRYAGMAGGAILLLIAIFALISGRRRQLTFNINLRR